MNQRERNARLEDVSPDETDPAVIQQAQFMFVVVYIATHELSVNSREEVLTILEGMDAENQEVAGLQTDEERQAFANNWEEIQFLATFLGMSADKIIERIDTGEEDEFSLEPDPNFDTRSRNVLEQLRERGLIDEKPLSNPADEQGS